MIAGRLTALLDWRPDDREKRLLQLLLGILLATWLYISVDTRQNAASENVAAQERLAKVRTQVELLSNNQLRAEIAVQKKLLEKLLVVDATPSISKIRLRGEVLDLSRRAGLTAPVILDNDTIDNDTADKSGRQVFVALTATVEFDFDWSGLLRLIEQVENDGRSYYIDGFEVRQEGDKLRMRVTFLALHKKEAPET
ncbi:MAG: hypothetical protein RJB02_2061 [Pseudomonadota bacterium]|jgi:hypothetical protein